MEAYNLENKNNNLPNKTEKSNTVLYLAGKLVSLLGTYIYNFALSLYVLKVTGSGTSFALSILMGVLPRVILGPIAGSVADRVDRKKIVVGLDILSGVVVLSLVGISSIIGLKIVLIYAVNLILAIISTFFDTAFSAAVPNLVSDRKLMAIMSYTQSVSSLSGIMGPLLGGLIYVLVPIQIFLIINGVSFIISAISEMFINFKFNKPERAETAESESFSFKMLIKDFKEIMVFLREQRALYTILKYSVGINFLINACMAVLLPYIINNVLKMTSSQYGAIDASFSIGILVMSLIMGRLPEKDKKRSILSIGLGMFGLLIILMGIPSLEIMSSFNINLLFGYYIIISIVFAVFLILVNVPLNVTAQRLIPDEMRGRLMGVLNSLSGGITPLGIIIAGILTDIVPTYIIFFICGIVLAIMAFALYNNRHVKDF